MAKSGTYMLTCGDHFYIGSSRNLRTRKFDHQWRLRGSNHPNENIQRAFESEGSATFKIIQDIPQLPGESIKDHRDRLRNAEQDLIDEHKDNPQMCNKSRNSRGSDNSEIMKRKWQDPEHRAKFMKGLEKTRTSPISEETRRKMAEAKKGRNNPFSRPVILTNKDGTETNFECLSDLAKHLGVSQQVLDLWIKGKSPWPGKGSCLRWKFMHLVGMSARFA